MARGEPMVNIRMPAGLKRALEEVAALEGRTLTAEINYRLERSLRKDKIALGVSEDVADYELNSEALRELPDDVQSILRQLITAVGRGLPSSEADLAHLRTNKPPSRLRNNLQATKKKRPKKSSQSGKGSDK